MTQKELYLHVGFPKTGTTTLQNFFWLNRAPLSNHSILYPNIGIVANAHHRLSPEHPQSKENGGLITPQALHNFIRDSKEDKVLLSTELLVATNKTFLRKLISELKVFFKVSTIVYVRRQDEYIDSLINQLTKQGTIERVDEGHISDLLSRFNYEKLLEFWESIVGHKNLIVRPFEKEQFYKEDLYSDFMNSVFEISNLSEFEKPTTKLNNKLSYCAVEFKGLINASSKSPTESSKYRNTLQNYSDERRSKTEDKHYVLPQEKRQEIRSESASINAAIASRYLPTAKNHSFFKNSQTKKGTNVEFTEVLKEFESIYQYFENSEPELAVELRNLLSIDPQNVRGSLETSYIQYKEGK